MSYTITSLEPQKTSSRISVYLEGDFAFGLYRDLASKARLKVGTRLKTADIDALVQADLVERFFDSACRILSHRPHSTHEIKSRLERKIYKFKPKVRMELWDSLDIAWPNIVQAVLDKLADYDYLNDEEFAKWWVDQRRYSNKPKGDYLIRRELLLRGVEIGLIDRLLLTDTSPSEHSRALAAARKVLYKYQNLPSREAHRKLSGYLRRQGFGWEVIREVIGDLLG